VARKGESAGIEPASGRGDPLLEIVVHTRRGVSSQPLPRSGSVVLGRGHNADICVPDPSVSRRHAVLHLGPPLRIEDLGSSNGTRVFDRRTAFATDRLIEVTRGTSAGTQDGLVELAPGDVIHLGTAQIVVRHHDGGAEGGPASGPRSGVIVEDTAMRTLYELAARVARGPIHVLLLGETGCGKEVLAETIHRASDRAARPFLCLSCVALSESLLESELFGHERGAFTGAIKSKPGLLETAEGGTVFLDEVGELPLALQAKLLRVIEDRKVTRVGGLNPKRIDVRFIAATNRNLEAEIARGAFRQDLFFRLNGIALTIPPLRERPAEIEPLARLFARRAAASLYPDRPVAISTEALEALKRHAWPGNIRELRNVMERAVVLSAGATIQPEQLLLHPKRSPHDPPAPHRETARTAVEPKEGEPLRLRDAMEAHERARIVRALDECHGNQTRAAELLGISRRTLVERLRTYGIPRPRRT
jgi:DNA-binding NtrC family response regulator